MQCKFKNEAGRCERDATPDWTMCKRHHSAGISRKHYRVAQKRKAQRKAGDNR